MLLRAALRPWWEELNASPEEVALCQIAIQRARDIDWEAETMLAPERRRDLALAFKGPLLGAEPV